MMSLVTTVPAPIKAYLPMVFPQIIVALAPMLAPFLTKVVLSSPIRGIALLGFIRLVKTIDGPQKTSSSKVTPL